MLVNGLHLFFRLQHCMFRSHYKRPSRLKMSLIPCVSQVSMHHVACLLMAHATCIVLALQLAWWTAGFYGAVAWMVSGGKKEEKKEEK